MLATATYDTNYAYCQTVLRKKDLSDSTNDPSLESPIELTVLMPCLDEAETLETCIKKAQSGIADANIVGEVLIADNGSTDGSQEIAERCGARVVNVKDKGYGSALRGGIADARGKWVIMGDADDSYDFSKISGFVEKLRAGNDLVMGCRLPRGGGTVMPGAMPWKHRWIGNPVLSFIGQLFFRSKVTDFHCGLRGFSKQAIEDLNLNTTGMEFASEMVIKATLQKLKIDQIPITLHPDGRSRPPHLRSWRDGWRHLRFMLLYSPRWLFLYPGLLMVLVGLLGSIWLMTGPKKIGNVELDVHTLVYFLFSVVLGFQVVFFAILTKTFAVNEGLLPDTKHSKTFARIFSLEAGLIGSLVLALLGIVGSIWAVYRWSSMEFGSIDPSNMMRLVLPSVLSLILGVQLFFNSFFYSVLGLTRRN